MSHHPLEQYDSKCSFTFSASPIYTESVPSSSLQKRCIADEVPFDIPESWEWVRLGRIVYNKEQMKPADDFCYIDIGSINQRY